MEKSISIQAQRHITFLTAETFQCANGVFSCALNTSTQAPFWQQSTNINLSLQQ